MDRPEKPYPEFPLYAHKSGQWCKKIRGKAVYFGAWADPMAALALYRKEVDDHQAGVTPSRTGEVTVKDVLDAYLDSSETDLDDGNIKAKTFRERKASCIFVADVLGRGTAISQLKPRHFEILKSKMSARFGPVRLKNEIHRVRSAFKYAFEADVIEKPVKFGPKFKGPSAAAIRKNKAGKPKKLFTAEQVRLCLNEAFPQMRVFILLALNCGFGQNDIATLPKAAVDLDAGWISYPRPKTGVVREAPLWPETVAAMRFLGSVSRKPLREEWEGLMYLTMQRRILVDPETGSDAIGQSFSRLLKKIGIKQQGVNFYSLRHTFQTRAEITGDQVAIKIVMGHADEDISANYREETHRHRLLAVTNAVRDWLKPETIQKLHENARSARTFEPMRFRKSDQGKEM